MKAGWNKTKRLKRPKKQQTTQGPQQSLVRSPRPTLGALIFNGLDAGEKYAETLFMIVGPNCAIQIEKEFCQTTGCPPGELEAWLKSEWIEHDVEAVKSLEVTAGPDPLILIRPLGAFYFIRLFSPDPEKTSIPVRPPERPN